jgi:hypothetical protein
MEGLDLAGFNAALLEQKLQNSALNGISTSYKSKVRKIAVLVPLTPGI